ncbi:MAG TPA: type II restriction endonuclease [Candidatus Paceibacterota bacterium]|nr:type II restriction endonuclease [Candidatus Paceibacterota bacterium]
MKNKELQKMIDLGSKTAKDGFKNEDYVIAEFNNWNKSIYAGEWLKKMNYKLNEIETVRATKISGHKADVQVEIKIEIRLKHLVDIQNLQVKLVSNPKGFNQIDKRWLKKYAELWSIPSDIYKLLQLYTGEKTPKSGKTRDSRRMFANEFTKNEKRKLIEFFKNNKTLIVSDILKGRGKFSAEWMLVILNLKKVKGIKWALEPINKVLNHFGNGEVLITDRGSIKIGHITVQRKGGDGGRETANMLQFKINPAEII